MRGRGRGRFTRSSLAARGCVDEDLVRSVSRRRRRRSANSGVENGVKVGGKSVSSWVDVDGGSKGPDIEGFLYTPLNPILLLD